MNVEYGKKIENKTREAVRAVLIKDNKIGIMKVDKFDCYIFPGGGVDDGEDFEVALKREAQEEAGLLIEVGEKILTTTSGEYEFTHINHYYLCDITGQTNTSLTDLEIGLGIHFKWIDKEDLYDFYLDYRDDTRFGEVNTIVQRSIRSRGHLIMTRLNKMFDWGLERRWIGKEVEVVFDRPVGYKQEPDYDPYPINYGGIKNIYSLDGDEVDCYYIDSKVPLESSLGRVVAVVKRFDDVEEKLVVSNLNPTKDEIKSAINFIEQYFDSIIVM